MIINNKGKIVAIVVQETLTMIFDSYIRENNIQRFNSQFYLL